MIVFLNAFHMNFTTLSRFNNGFFLIWYWIMGVQICFLPHNLSHVFFLWMITQNISFTCFLPMIWYPLRKKLLQCYLLMIPHFPMKSECIWCINRNWAMGNHREKPPNEAILLHSYCHWITIPCRGVKIYLWISN